MAIENIVALDNVKKVAEDKTIPANTEIDVNMSNAYIESKDAAEHVTNVIKELDKTAEEIKTDAPETPKIKAKNMYTKLTLDESIQDFNLSLKDLSDESDEDIYLDYDMFDFVYGLVTEDWPRPKNPLGRRMRKFQHTDSDDYAKSNEMTGMSQVATDPNGNVVIYANTADAFNDVREACDYYHLTYSDVRPKMNKDSHWAFNMTINVPMTSDGYPVMVEDFFAEYGWSLSDVIEDHKVGGGKSANWGKTYEKNAAKDRADATKYVNDRAVEDIFDKFVNKAAVNGDIDLDVFIKEMFAELDSKNLSYSKVSLKRRFISEFEDNFEDEDDIDEI